jgi:hypothetical protein
MKRIPSLIAISFITASSALTLSAESAFRPLIQAQVISVTPVQNAVNVAPGTNISVTFDDDMDPSSINDTTFIAMGNFSGLHPGVISYNNGTLTATLNPGSDFTVGEIVTIMLTSGIIDTAGIPITGFVWNFTIVAPRGVGAFAAPQYSPANTGPNGIIIARLNNDQFLDLAVTNATSQDVSVMFGNGDGTFAAPANYSIAQNLSTLAAGDLDRDGDIDIVVASQGADRIDVLVNDGSGTFSLTGNYPTGLGPVSVFLSDVNQDGKMDAITANSGANTFSVLFGNGDGSFQVSTNYAAGPTPTGVYGGDLDGDGDIDITTAVTNDRIALALNNGDGTFASGGTVTIGDAPSGVFAASLNAGDDFLDLTSTNRNSNDMSVCLGNGDGSFQSSIEYPVSTAPVRLTGGDFNADNALDIIVSCTAADTISLLFNDGNAQFNPPVRLYGGDSVRSLCAGDFDSDSSLDIAVACFNSDNIAVLLNIGDTIPPYVVSTTPSNGASNIPLSDNVLITFSEAMDTASFDTSKFHIAGSVNPSYQYVLSYNPSNNTVTLNPDSLFATSETITVDVAQTVTDLFGNPMAAPYSFYFTTVSAPDTTPPGVASVSPDSAETGVAVDVWIHVTFTERIEPATVTSDKIHINGSINGLYTFTMSYNQIDSTLSIDPDSNFAALESISVRIDSTITYLSGNPMAHDHWFWFRTADSDTTPNGGEFLPERQVYVWPNPAHGDSVYFHYYVSTNATVTVEIYNLSGKQVAKLEGSGIGGIPPHQLSSNAIMWDISDVASDIYVFRFTAESDVSSESGTVFGRFAISK